MNDINDLDKLRIKINETDDKIVKLLLERFEIVKDVAVYKKANGIEILQTNREAEVLQNITDKTDNPEYKKYLTEIYETILKTSKLSQK